MRLVGISGSLQLGSANTALLEVARAVAAENIEVVLFESLAEVPNFIPDTPSLPGPVGEFHALVETADGLLIATPEYAHGVPGSLKNLLDWSVGSGDLYGKSVVILSAAPAPDRGAHARADVERTLLAQGARVLASSTIAVPTAVRGAEADDPDIRRAVGEALQVFVDQL